MILHLNDRLNRIVFFCNGAGKDRSIHAQIGEQQRQYAHTAETLGTLLHECGFTDVAVFGDKHMEAPGEKECRWFVAARKPLGGAEV